MEVVNLQRSSILCSSCAEAKRFVVSLIYQTPLSIAFYEYASILSVRQPRIRSRNKVLFTSTVSSYEDESQPSVRN